MDKVHNTKAILFNGPKEAGKDVALIEAMSKCYDLLEGCHSPVQIRKLECKDHLHTLVQNLFCVPENRYWEIYNDRELKEQPSSYFGIVLDDIEYRSISEVLGYNLMFPNQPYIPSGRVGERAGEVCLSIREALIYVSEVVCKPRFWVDYFGKVRASKVESNQLIFDGSAAAFEVGGEIVCDEVPPLLERIGEDNCLLIRVHRPGYTFDGDSRRYIPDGVVPNIVDVYNDGTLEEFFTKVGDEVNRFLEG